MRATPRQIPEIITPEQSPEMRAIVERARQLLRVYRVSGYKRLPGNGGGVHWSGRVQAFTADEAKYEAARLANCDGMRFHAVRLATPTTGAREAVRRG